jgi:hypothetical protein
MTAREMMGQKMGSKRRRRKMHMRWAGRGVRWSCSSTHSLLYKRQQYAH